MEFYMSYLQNRTGKDRTWRHRGEEEKTGQDRTRQARTGRCAHSGARRFLTFVTSGIVLGVQGAGSRGWEQGAGGGSLTDY